MSEPLAAARARVAELEQECQGLSVKIAEHEFRQIEDASALRRHSLAVEGAVLGDEPLPARPQTAADVAERIPILKRRRAERESELVIARSQVRAQIVEHVKAERQQAIESYASECEKLARAWLDVVVLDHVLQAAGGQSALPPQFLTLTLPAIGTMREITPGGPYFLASHTIEQGIARDVAARRAAIERALGMPLPW